MELDKAFLSARFDKCERLALPEHLSLLPFKCLPYRAGKYRGQSHPCWSAKQDNPLHISPRVDRRLIFGPSTPATSGPRGEPGLHTVADFDQCLFLSTPV